MKKPLISLLLAFIAFPVLAQADLILSVGSTAIISAQDLGEDGTTRVSCEYRPSAPRRFTARVLHSTGSTHSWCSPGLASTSVDKAEREALNKCSSAGYKAENCLTVSSDVVFTGDSRGGRGDCYVILTKQGR